MTAIYAYLYIPIIILIVNSLTARALASTGRVLPLNGIAADEQRQPVTGSAAFTDNGGVSATFATLIGSLTAVALYRYPFVVSRSLAECCLW